MSLIAAIAAGVIGGVKAAYEQNKSITEINKLRAEALNQLEQLLKQNAEAYFSNPARTAYDKQQALATAENLWQSVIYVLSHGPVPSNPNGGWDDWGRNGYEERKLGGKYDWEGKYVESIRTDNPPASILSKIEEPVAKYGIRWPVILAGVLLASVIILKVVK